jgi:hypothetical protein
MLEKGFELVRALHAQGVEILAGTDVVKPFFVPGFALQDELPFLEGHGAIGTRMERNADGALAERWASARSCRRQTRRSSCSRRSVIETTG